MILSLLHSFCSGVRSGILDTGGPSGSGSSMVSSNDSGSGKLFLKKIPIAVYKNGKIFLSVSTVYSKKRQFWKTKTNIKGMNGKNMHNSNNDWYYTVVIEAK